MKKIFVGNLSFDTTEADVRKLFEAHGPVESVALVTDSMTGRSRGFAFVEIANDGEAEKVIATLANTELGGRKLNINEARPKREGGGGGGDRGGNRGGRGGGGGGRPGRW
jgi:cold-inducible RNA-binding protein